MQRSLDISMAISRPPSVERVDGYARSAGPHSPKLASAAAYGKHSAQSPG